MGAGNLYFSKFVRSSFSTLKFENHCLCGMALEGPLGAWGRGREAAAGMVWAGGEGVKSNGRLEGISGLRALSSAAELLT